MQVFYCPVNLFNFPSFNLIVSMKFYQMVAVSHVSFFILRVESLMKKDLQSCRVVLETICRKIQYDLQIRLTKPSINETSKREPPKIHFWGLIPIIQNFSWDLPTFLVIWLYLYDLSFIYQLKFWILELETYPYRTCPIIFFFLVAPLILLLGITDQISDW